MGGCVASLSPRFNTVDIGQGGQEFHTGFLSASLFLIIFASINEKNFFSFFIAEQNGKIFLLAGEGKAVRTGRAYIEDALAARHESFKVWNTQFQGLKHLVPKPGTPNSKYLEILFSKAQK